MSQETDPIALDQFRCRSAFVVLDLLLLQTQRYRDVDDLETGLQSRGTVQLGDNQLVQEISEKITS
jgi:hypothetical protein